MVTVRDSPRLLPFAAGAFLLVVVLGIAILPNTGSANAQSNCEYGVCTNSGPSVTSWVVVLVILGVVALALAILILRGRQRPPSGAPQEWESGDVGPSGGPADYTDSGPSIPEGVAAGAVVGAPIAAYVETPEDVSAAPPSEAVAGVAAGGAAAAATEPDIDSLMAELDKISGEILTRGTPPKKPPTTDLPDEKSS